MSSRHGWILFSCSIALSIASAIAISQPNVQSFIENSGVNIPTTDVVRDYAYGICWGFALLLFILLWPINWKHKRMLAAGWLVKCVVALVLMLPYEQQYWGLDCWTYFQRAHSGVGGMIAGLANNGGNIVTGLGALHLEIGPDSYHAMKLSFAMIGFLAIYLFYRAAEILIGCYSPFAFWLLLLYPSALFWSSIMGKDPLILAAIGLNVWGVVNLAVRSAERSMFSPYSPASALQVSFAFGWGRSSWCRAFCWQLLVSNTPDGKSQRSFLLGLPWSCWSRLTFNRLQFDRAADLVEATRTVTAGWDRANSSMRLDAELHSTWDLLLFTPQTMFIAYFRPLPGDIPNLFGWLAGFENLGLLLLSAWAVLRIRLRHFRAHLFIWALALLVTWGTAYSIIAYRDLGAAVRYKLQIIPILLGVIGYLCRQPSSVRSSERTLGMPNGQRRRVGLTLP